MSDNNNEPLDLGPIEKRLKLLGSDTWQELWGCDEHGVWVEWGRGTEPNALSTGSLDLDGPVEEALLHANRDIAALVEEVKRLRAELEKGRI